ncbi:MAG: hypothetical protein KAR22_02015, partial [Gammaproteobacteria bacterium]|nr:hypothetical protein [Gammaproteobacteria bacterium]
ILAQASRIENGAMNVSAGHGIPNPEELKTIPAFAIRDLRLSSQQLVHIQAIPSFTGVVISDCRYLF